MPSSLTPLNANLTRRLAEAADGLRNNKYYFFISKSDYPFDLKSTEGYTDADEANTAADTLLAQWGSQYKKYGPFYTPSDCSPSIDYDSIEIKFLKGGIEVKTETLAKDVDTIILNLSAYDKFFAPYYARLYGTEIAQSFRQAAETTLTSAALYSPVKHAGLTIQKAGSVEG